MPVTSSDIPDRDALRGRITAIRGQPGSGKTLLAKHCARRFLREGAAVLWVDGDRTLCPGQANLSDVIVVRPPDMTALTVWLDTFLGCDRLAIIVIDALDALPPHGDKTHPHWTKWTSEDDLFVLLRKHAQLGVAVIYTEHAVGFAFGRAISNRRLSRRLSTDLRICATSDRRTKR